MIVVLNKLGPSLNLGGPACCILLLIINYLFMGCGDRDAVVVDPLESALVKIEDNSDAVRLEGINELSSLGDKAKPHAAKIALLLKDSSAEIRNIAVSLIGVWQYQDSGVLVDLKTLAVDDDAGVEASDLSDAADDFFTHFGHHFPEEALIYQSRQDLMRVITFAMVAR